MSRYQPKYKYGCLRDHHDQRDHLYKLAAPVQLQTVRLKDKFKMPEIFNQLQTGSCTGNGSARIGGFAAMNGYVQNSNVPCDLPFSRLFIYGNARKMEGTFRRDAGAQIRDVMKVIASIGMCSELLWPYIESKFNVWPDQKCFDEALKFTGVEYSRVNNLSRQDIVGSLLQGYPVIIGIKVYQSFESEAVAKTGIVPMPGKNERCLGGHCVVIEEYDMNADRFGLANSWGTEWGMDGYFTLPGDYICSSLSNDAWNLKKIL